MRILLSGLRIGLVCGGTGCQARLNFEKTLGLDRNQVETLAVDAPTREQKIVVTITSSACPVDVYVVLEKDQEAATQALESHLHPKNSLASQTNVKETTLEATFPGRKGFAVLIGESKVTTTVKVKIASK